MPAPRGNSSGKQFYRNFNTKITRTNVAGTLGPLLCNPGTYVRTRASVEKGASLVAGSPWLKSQGWEISMTWTLARGARNSPYPRPSEVQTGRATKLLQVTEDSNGPSSPVSWDRCPSSIPPEFFAA